MKNRKFQNYGIYIDRNRSFILASDSILYEEVIQPGIQNTKEICSTIISRLDNAHRILIFGPSKPKYILQQEIRKSENMNHVSEEVLITEQMNGEEALFFLQKIIPFS